MIFKNIVCIDLTKFEKGGDIEKIFEDNGITITEKIDPFLLWNLKPDLNKIYYDPTVDEYVIFEDIDGDIHYLEYFLNQLKSFPSLDRKKYFDVNDILDKINKLGINSLTKEEKDFLENS
jgi:hypothetical protein